MDAPTADAPTADACCEACSSPLVLISFVQGSATMTMGSCAICHTRSWWRDGVPADLPVVLADLAHTAREAAS